MSERYLTSGEKKLVDQVFNNKIDTSNVKIIQKSYLWFNMQGEGYYMAPDGNIYVKEGSYIYRNDYSVDPNPHTRAKFIHEMEHVYQHQQGEDVRIKGLFEQLNEFIFRDSYLYPDLKNLNQEYFNKLGIEQRTAIVEDYYLFRYHGIKEKGSNINFDDYKRILPFNPECFLAGTKISVEKEKFVNIENIKPGDIVQCFDSTNAFRNKKII